MSTTPAPPVDDTDAPMCCGVEAGALYRFASVCGHADTDHATMLSIDGDPICLDSPTGEHRCDQCGDIVCDDADDDLDDLEEGLP
ncbi:hypothetical protein [Gordonia malaquae]|uniref:hypothetical protein n=1 Tax=Gordonia malaquae TaxID=410332 RepID=UPI00301A8B2D